MRLALVLVLALALLGAGCGEDDEVSSGTDTVVTETTTTDETTTDETATDDLGGIDLDDEDCRQLLDASTAIGRLFAAPGAEPEESEAFEELVDRVPAEIRDDYQVLANALAEYREALADIDVDAGETPSADDVQTLLQALGSIDQPAVTEATQNITAWVDDNCAQ
jgi:hypothetical protein